MKLCKVKITKDRTPTGTHFTYPEGYDAHVLSPFLYQNEGDNIEHCLATVPDDFKFTKDMEEVDKETAEVLVDSWIDDDKDLDAAIVAGKISFEEITECKMKRREYCKDSYLLSRT